MPAQLTELPPDLRELVERFIASERTEKQRLEFENRILREQVRLLMLQKYGPKSDKLSDLQLQLLESEPCVTSDEVAAEADRGETTPAARKPRVPGGDPKHPGRVELPAHLERPTQIIPAAPEDCHCGRCCHSPSGCRYVCRIRHHQTWRCSSGVGNWCLDLSAFARIEDLRLEFPVRYRCRWRNCDL